MVDMATEKQDMHCMRKSWELKTPERAQKIVIDFAGHLTAKPASAHLAEEPCTPHNKIKEIHV